MKKVLFIKNTLILTVTAFILRIIGMVFRVWLVGKIGAEGMGLYQVIFSVYVLASTFATSGISTAVIRMVTERLTIGDKRGAKRVLWVSVATCLIIAAVTSGIIILFATPISKYLIGDMRAVLSLKALCLGLPFMGVCSCFRGYFLARRSTVPPSLCQIFEQFARIAVIMFLIGKFSHMGLEITSAVVLLGDSIADGVGCLSIWAFYRFDFKRLYQKAADTLKKRAVFLELFRISAPISAGRYLHTSLRTAESLLTPTCLAKYSGTKTAALEQFGMIKGMAIPILLFPASLLSAVSALLIPEITQSVAEKKLSSVQNAVEKIFASTSAVSFMIAAIFFTAAEPLGELVYSSNSVGWLIKSLAPLVPFMYIDLIADGVLKGLDEQNFLFKINIIDSLVRLILVFLLVPKFGMMGFLGVMLFSNLFTSILAVIKILFTTKVFWDYKKYFLKPLISAGLAAFIADIICKNIENCNILYMVVSVFVVVALYVVFMCAMGGLDFKSFIAKKHDFKGKKSKTV